MPQSGENTTCAVLNQTLLFCKQLEHRLYHTHTTITDLQHAVLSIEQRFGQFEYLI